MGNWEIGEVGCGVWGVGNWGSGVWGIGEMGDHFVRVAGEMGDGSREKKADH
ncbi:MAG UNVERIFIED_CONTAM: hypothetical protein LVR29_07460 [Microcystis novacekii LVE1205-3]